MLRIAICFWLCILSIAPLSAAMRIEADAVARALAMPTDTLHEHEGHAPLVAAARRADGCDDTRHYRSAVDTDFSLVVALCRRGEFAPSAVAATARAAHARAERERAQRGVNPQLAPLFELTRVPLGSGEGYTFLTPLIAQGTTFVPTAAAALGDSGATLVLQMGVDTHALASPDGWSICGKRQVMTEMAAILRNLHAHFMRAQ